MFTCPCAPRILKERWTTPERIAVYALGLMSISVRPSRYETRLWFAPGSFFWSLAGVAAWGVVRWMMPHAGQETQIKMKKLQNEIEHAVIALSVFVMLLLVMTVVAYQSADRAP